MSTLSLALPAEAPEAWADAAAERFRLRLSRLAHDLGVSAPPLSVVRARTAPAVSFGGTPLGPPRGPAGAMAEQVLAALPGVLAWPALLAPALAAQGFAETWWLRHAARRGLGLQDLLSLSAGADEEALAWRLAERHPPLLVVRAGRSAAKALADADLRERAARDSASWSGLPIPLPPPPEQDPFLAPDEAALSLGALGFAPFRADGAGGWRAALGQALWDIAPVLVDPALVLALLTDEARLSRRHATLALSRTGAVAIARRIAEASEESEDPVDLAAIVDDAAGLSPA